jgi:hypothetical protein
MAVKSLPNFCFHKSDAELILPDQMKLLKYKVIRINHNACIGYFCFNYPESRVILVERPSFEEKFNTTRTILKSVSAHHKLTLDL